MNSNKRPHSVTILACVYLAVGTIGFAYHFRELLVLQDEGIWVELSEFLAIVSGAFMLRGHTTGRAGLLSLGLHSFAYRDNLLST